LESTPEADAFADDLGTMTLDVLMSERAYSRNSLNLFLLQK
jgi:formate dehydrogenase maturation protein FdhE